MHRRKRDVVAVVHLVGVGRERYLLQIIGERRIGIQLAKFVHRADKFFNVGKLVDAVVAAIRIRFAHTRVRNDELYKLVDRHILTFNNPLFDKPEKCFQLRTCACVEAHLIQVQHRIVNGQLFTSGVRLQFIHRRLTDATLGEIDNSYDCFAVQRVVDDSKISKQILDFLTLEELEAAKDLERDSVRRKFLLEGTRERIETHQHRKVGKLVAVFAHQSCNRMGNVAGFVRFLLPFVNLRLVPFGVLRPKHLLLASAVVFNHFVGKHQNFFGRTIVSFQLEYLRTGEVLFKVQNIFQLRTTPAVDGLVIVAYHEQVFVRRREHSHDVVLYAVGVLKLIDKHVTEFAA